MSKRPPLIGLTGNIGSGKTTVGREFERLGIPVYYADAAAKRLMREDLELRVAIQDRFGKASYQTDGELNRTYLAEQVFGDDEALAALNALVHPAVHRDAESWRAGHHHAPYLLYEAAILLEIGRAHAFEAVLVVHAPLEERMRRVMARDGATEAAFQARAAKQWTDERKLAAADFIINNRGGDLIWPQILAHHQRFLLL
ncbi:dephospho-CoA kinase [Lewinella sp. 4G2]|uniref:dephospho-CoA kinase n=1 Tax=Lewinella sp. 4G2 TaxID=1803372 RepID=UPI0007B4791C|nr:dephospho-CoA kinase [Lewinella sp. 4G2]OAV44956.1 dephospho-CoA kinase [Lewinella sp. 4G2]